MIESYDVFELFNLFLVISLIATVILLTWMSTYVNSDSFVTTTLVFYERGLSQSSSANSRATQTTPLSRMETPAPSHGGSPSAGAESLAGLSSHLNRNSCLVRGDSDHSVSELVGGCVSNEEEEQKGNYHIKPKQPVEDKATLNSQEMSAASNDHDALEDRKNVSSSLSNHETPINGAIVKASEVTNVESSCSFPSGITVKLKFLDDTQRLVSSKLSEKLGNFKRVHFSSELSTNQVVRLIFNGRLLNEDSSTLAQCGIFDNCTVHCHISQARALDSPGEVIRREEENGALDLSELLNPLLLGILVFLWYLRYEYGNVFNTPATIILVCLTALLLISQYALVISFNVSVRYENDSSNSNANTSAVGADSPSIESDSTPPPSSRVSDPSNILDSDGRTHGEEVLSPEGEGEHSGRSLGCLNQSAAASSENEAHIRIRRHIAETTCDSS